jgi:hypothetical protein
MKTRKLLVVILVAVLITVYYLLGTDYFKQHRYQKTLASQISGATEALALLPQPAADIAERLASAQADLDIAKNSLVVDTNYTVIVNKILRLAQEIGVKAIPLTTQPWTIENVSNQDYAVFHLNIAVTGTFEGLVSFINRLETGDPATLVIEYMTVDRTPAYSGGESAAGGETPVNASLSLAVYAPPTAAN